MLWLARMLQEKQATTQAAATCDLPSQLHGKPVSAIADDFNCSQWPVFSLSLSLWASIAFRWTILTGRLLLLLLLLLQRSRS